MVFPSLVDKRFCTTPVTVTLYQDGNDEDGEPQEAFIFEGVCNYQDSAKTVLTADKRLVRGDVLIDDGVQNLVGGDYEKLLYTQPHNRAFDAAAAGMTRVNDWRGIAAYFHLAVSF